MWFKKKAKQKKVKREAAPQLFFLIGFLATPLTTEVINICRSFIISRGEMAFNIYSLVILTFWAGTMFIFMWMIDKVYEK